jgi:hypothetical protein
VLRSLFILGSLTGCLEKVTGEPVALDARFTVQPGSTTEGDDTGGPGHTEMSHEAMEHVEVPPPPPFKDFEGERVLVSGTISSDVPKSVDLDVSQIDETVEGGLVSEGKLIFDGPGDFELSVPVSVGQLKLSAFQDIEGDGPSLDDPYAELDIEVGTEAIASLEFALVIGARGAALGGPEHTDAEHVDAPPGFGSGQAPPADGQSRGADPFEGVEGERVTVSGVLVYAGAGVIDVDLFKADASAPGGRTLLGKLKKNAGPFVLQVPIAIGTMELDAFADRTGDGPSGDDPRGSVRGLVLTEGAVRGLELNLVTLSEVPQTQPENPGGTDIEEEFARTGAVGKEQVSDGDGL